MGIKCLSLNCHRSVAAVTVVANSLTDHSIAFLQEPAYNKKRNKLLGLIGHKTFSSKGNGRPRTAIVAGKGVNAWQENKYGSRDMTVIIVRADGVTTYFASCYLDIVCGGQPVCWQARPSLFSLGFVPFCPRAHYIKTCRMASRP